MMMMMKLMLMLMMMMMMMMETDGTFKKPIQPCYPSFETDSPQ